MRLLVVDWDYFFENPMGSGRKDWPLYDWSHKETEFFIGPIWDSRAQGFIMQGMELPGTTGLEKTFWQRFRFSPKAKLYVGCLHPGPSPG